MPNTSNFFPEVNDSIMESLPVSNVKASPSINSANDGSFNSEENLKWSNRKLAQKPFIVGETSEDIRKSFAFIQNDGDNIRISPGMLSADGYLFKISDTENISYDQDPSENFSLDVTTKYMTKFIQGLTKQTDEETKISTNINDFVFSEYRTNDPENAEFQTNWFEASANEGTLVGYIVNTYGGISPDEYFNSLEIGDTTDEDVPDYVTFSTNSIVIANSNNSNIMGSLTEITDIDDIKQFNENEFFKIGDPFALYTDGENKIIIYYPVKITYKNIFNKETGKYENKFMLAYTNIFGLFNYFDTPIIESRTYPNTFSSMCTMKINHPLDDIGFADCNKLTWAKTMYDLDMFYSDSYQRYKKEDFNLLPPPSFNVHGIAVDGQTSGISTYDKILNDIFERETALSVANKYIPENSDIQYHEGIFDYLCIKDISNEWKQQVTVGGVTKYVPVCFMTEDGILCPYGFTYGDDNSHVTNDYPVEGYLHFIKRLYCQYKLQITPTEQDIKNVTAKQLTGWTSGTPNFYSLYKKIMPYIGFYMQLCYSSNIDNVLFINENTDYKNMNFNGCGVALAEAISEDPESNDFYTYMTVTTNNGAIQKGGSQFTVTSANTTQKYQKDISSDKYRIVNRIDALNNGQTLVPGQITEDNTENINSSVYDYYSSPEKTVNGTNVELIGIEDPISYIRRCYFVWDYNVSIKSKRDTYAYLRKKDDNFTFTLYQLYYDENEDKFILTPVDTDIMCKNVPHYSSNNPSGNIVIDEYLMPRKLPKEDCPEYIYTPDDAGSISNSEPILFEDSYDAWFETKMQYNNTTQEEYSTIANGMNLCWRQYSWKTAVPYVVETQYDALGYLRGSDIESISNYKGLKMYYKFPEEIESDDLVIFNVLFSNIASNANFDVDSNNIDLDTDWEDSNSKRETYISANKIYGMSNNIINNVTNITNVIGDQSTDNVIQALPFAEVVYLTSFISGFDDLSDEWTQLREILNDPTLSPNSSRFRYTDKSQLITIPLRTYKNDYCFGLVTVRSFEDPIELKGKEDYTQTDLLHVTLNKYPVLANTVDINNNTYIDNDPRTIGGVYKGDIIEKSTNNIVGTIYYNTGEIEFDSDIEVTGVSYSMSVTFSTDPMNIDMQQYVDTNGIKEIHFNIHNTQFHKTFEHKVLIQDDGMAEPQAVNIQVPYTPPFGYKYFTVMLLRVNAEKLKSYGVNIGIDSSISADY
jgi:hypothetical protein